MYLVEGWEERGKGYRRKGRKDNMDKVKREREREKMGREGGKETKKKKSTYIIAPGNSRSPRATHHPTHVRTGLRTRGTGDSI